ncbi:MAG TPA: HIT domain-containing protein [Candidatus Binataceae bacterium]|nr:HIT domain-containing protein [Candidatus Binataceae bacterium]
MMEPRGPGGRGDPVWRQLWAPWRAAYIRGASSRSDTARCIFCFGGLKEASRRRRLVLLAGPEASVMLNRYPYNNCHLLIAPRRHVAALEDLSQSESSTINSLLSASVRILKQALAPHGFNLGANLGRVAGAGIADHMHWHVVPRWNGDTNFMPVMTQTRVASEHLEASFALLEPLFRQLQSPVS